MQTVPMMKVPETQDSQRVVLPRHELQGKLQELHLVNLLVANEGQMEPELREV